MLWEQHVPCQSPERQVPDFAGNVSGRTSYLMQSLSETDFDCPNSNGVKGDIAAI
jgi:hypothetical protein